MAIVQSELELVANEKSRLLTDRKKLEDEKGFHKSLVDSAQGLKDDLSKSLNLLSERDADLEKLQRNINRLQTQRKEEEQQLEQMMKTVDSKLATGGSVLDQMVKVVQKNAD